MTRLQGCNSETQSTVAQSRGSSLSSLRLLTIAMLLLSVTGCSWLGRHRGDSWWLPRSCRFNPDVAQDELIAALNEDSANLQSWESTSVTLKAHGQGALPIGLPAKIAVERPRHFRLLASSPLGGSELDLGSNAEQFWFWTRQDPENHIYFANHEEFQGANARGRLPLHPDWLMSALGMQPLESSQLTMTRLDDKRVQLTPLSTDSQSSLQRTLIVDLCRGHVIEQILTDQAGQVWARIKFEDYHRCHESTTMLPHRITIDSPPSGMTIEMHLGRINVNPPRMSEQLWMMPKIADASPMNLGSMISRQPLQQAGGIRQPREVIDSRRESKTARPQSFPVYRMQPPSGNEAPAWEPVDHSPF